MKLESIRVSLVVLLLGLVAPSRVQAEATPLRTHVVNEGQQLVSIAKRYGVTVDAITRANNIRRDDTIRPGQRLVIPAAVRKAQAAPAPRSGGGKGELLHKVEAGHRIELIARRYHVSVAALCRANGIERDSIIRPGQSLTIPRGGSDSLPSSKDTSFGRYLRAPKTKGRVALASHSQRFEGVVFDKKGKLLPAAANGIQRVLATGGARPRADQRLVRLLVMVSDRFGGRPLRVVSGYRTTSFFEGSKHKSSRAVDFSIPGVPNEALRDYLRTIPNVGVGYYPNSSFVHLDVREYSAYWVDHAGPGEAPRGSAVARHPHQPAAVQPLEPAEPQDSADWPSRGALPATGTSALSGLAQDSSFTSTRGERAASPVLPRARPSSHDIELR